MAENQHKAQNAHEAMIERYKTFIDAADEGTFLMGNLPSLFEENSAYRAFSGSFDEARICMTMLTPDWWICDMSELPRTRQWTVRLAMRGDTPANLRPSYAMAPNPGRALLLAVMRAYMDELEGQA